MGFNPNDRMALFIDGPNFYGSIRDVGIKVDYTRLLDFFHGKARLLRAYYYTALMEDRTEERNDFLRRLTDWLSFNGYTVITKPTKVFQDASGGQVMKGNKVLRYNAAALRFANALKESKEELTIFFAATGIVLYIAAVGIYHFEHEAQPDVFQSVFHALWWAAMTVTTVGYGDVYPITTGGRIFTSIVVLLALGIVAVPAGILAAALSAERARVRETESDRERGDPQPTAPS